MKRVWEKIKDIFMVIGFVLSGVFAVVVSVLAFRRDRSGGDISDYGERVARDQGELTAAEDYHQEAADGVSDAEDRLDTIDSGLESVGDLAGDNIDIVDGVARRGPTTGEKEEGLEGGGGG